MRRTLQLGLLLGLALIIGFAVTPSSTQAAVAASVQVVNPATQPVPVQDIENPARSPYQQYFEYSWVPLQGDVLVTTVPAGKRLVLEHISYISGAAAPDQLTRGMIRSGYYGTNAVVILEIHPPHLSGLDAEDTEQDGSQMVKGYFEPGTEIWLRVTHTTNNTRYMLLTLNGYYVNVP